MQLSTAERLFPQRKRCVATATSYGLDAHFVAHFVARFAIPSPTIRIRAGAQFHHHVKQCPRAISKAKDPKAVGRWLARAVADEGGTFVTAPHGAITCFTTCATDVDQAKDMVDRLFKAVMRNNMEEAGYY